MLLLIGSEKELLFSLPIEDHCSGEEVELVRFLYQNQLKKVREHELFHSDCTLSWQVIGQKLIQVGDKKHDRAVLWQVMQDRRNQFNYHKTGS